MASNITSIKSLRIFFSYSTSDKEFVVELKKYLEFMGFDVFLAHEDISPCAEWQEEILKNLDMTDIFIAILTNNFKKSDWTDQETGIAVAGQKFIIPIQIELTPYGFINKYQSLKIRKDAPNHAAEISNQIVDAIIKRSKFKEDMKGFFINAFAESSSFDSGNMRTKILCNKFDNFTKEEIKTMYDATIENNQINCSFGAQNTLKYFFNNHKDSLSEEEHEKIIEKLK